MSLKEFIKKHASEEKISTLAAVKWFAAQCGLSWHTLNNVVYGVTKPSLKLAAEISYRSCHTISMEELRPDLLPALRKMVALPLTTNLKFEEIFMRQFTDGQRSLIKKHGTPADFALTVYACCPSDISMDEAEAAVQKYRREFHAA